MLGTVKELILGDVLQELANTRRMLENLPQEHMTWKPHEKSMSMGELATHIVNLLYWQSAILVNAEFDLASVPSRREVLESPAAVLQEFDVRSREVQSMLAESSAEMLGAEWTLRNGTQIIHRQPRAVALRTFGLNHLVHHRAQLGIYLRLLDLPVPGMYGPSADELGR
ncbi:DinB family protein [Paenibacillus sacheonensis]|uniref:DinB family protein n=1 Tax=Paenibacillus sacheonensis TaxID=742054 RepID=UPI0030843E2E